MSQVSQLPTTDVLALLGNLLTASTLPEPFCEAFGSLLKEHAPPSPLAEEVSIETLLKWDKRVKLLANNKKQSDAKLEKLTKQLEETKAKNQQLAVDFEEAQAEHHNAYAAQLKQTAPKPSANQAEDTQGNTEGVVRNDAMEVESLGASGSNLASSNDESSRKRILQNSAALAKQRDELLENLRKVRRRTNAEIDGNTPPLRQPTAPSQEEDDWTTVAEQIAQIQQAAVDTVLKAQQQG